MNWQIYFRVSQEMLVKGRTSIQLWFMVNGTRGRSAKNTGIQLSGQPVDIEALISYFASVTTDSNYDMKVTRSFLDTIIMITCR